eukprot:5640103-Lingulodinium_polyedra.AAC.1
MRRAGPLPAVRSCGRRAAPPPRSAPLSLGDGLGRARGLPRVGRQRGARHCAPRRHPRRPFARVGRSGGTV